MSPHPLPHRRSHRMAIDFTLAPEHEEVRQRVRSFVLDTIVPATKDFDDENRVLARDEYIRTIFSLRKQAKEEGLWLPHMPKEWGGMGLGHAFYDVGQAVAHL